jgi:hypothetical protein
MSAPTRVEDLAATAIDNNKIRLNWTAPSDDVVCTSYDIRYSLVPINTLNWASRTQATGEPIPAIPGSPEVFTVYGLSHDTRYYFGLITSDGDGGNSPLSNVPSDETFALPANPSPFPNHLNN